MAQPSPSLHEVDAAAAAAPRRSRLHACESAAAGAGTLVVVPTYDERENLQALVRAVLEVAPGAHVLVVDDASPDGTGELARALAAGEPRLHVLHRPRKQGLGTAYVAGFSWGLERAYQRFVEMDADFSHDPRELPRLLAALDTGADLAVGSRNVPGGAVVGWGMGRLLLSKGGSAYSRVVLGVGVRDLTTGYKAYTRAALLRLGLGSLRSNGYAFQIETTFRAVCERLRVQEIPITFVDRRVGKSKMDARIFREAVLVVWRLRFEALRRKA